MAVTQQHIGRKRNLLHRYQAVMEEFNKHDCRLIPISVIYREYIYPKFHISRDTLYRILNTPIEQELEKVKKLQAQQLSLFD
ncbi:hypothetical protein EDM00_10665 [Ornithobacterium rhinotracheale]|uniref:hypothetical protein n=1 Tax=Ornithobacterium rhinotracheale TaxID=28251 RepID=UPI00129C542C|nr:hypothetical protein [Ornithobacterium rhinotracheale]MRI64442.1 hypothetical protein [Ornithobacterium rhinotracheale]MRJ09438.1 hypothetical protein [Ornithobacterium rhinotracheale]UOH77327.1 hypothetical protein MT996_08915 [Ornithobacterium rhinotracheale]